VIEPDYGQILDLELARRDQQDLDEHPVVRIGNDRNWDVEAP
jgi:hypothetical protein